MERLSLLKISGLVVDQEAAAEVCVCVCVCVLAEEREASGGKESGIAWELNCGETA